MLNKKHSKETKLKMSLSAKGNKAFLGRKHTEETKKKMSKPRPKRQGIPAWNKGTGRFKTIREKELHFNLKKYGIGPETYNEMLLKQNNVCAICYLPETKIHNKTGLVCKLSVDHCHNTGKVRGLLCTKCNTGIGQLSDSPELCINAYNYLKNHLQ